MSFSNNHSSSKSGQKSSSIYNPSSSLQSNNYSSNNSNNNNKNFNSDDIQFKVLSKSPHKNRIKNNAHQYENVYDVMGKPNQTQKLNQIVMNESSDIFNDGIEGGGVEPSINESIRQSIQCSFVSQESFDTRQKYQQQEQQPTLDAQRSLQVMNRMNWITYLKVLFDQLESFNQNKQKHVETANFLKGFKKIKHLLPLQTRNEYFKNCSEVAFTYKEVENGINKMPQYITWDNVIDIFLTKSFSQKAVISNQPKQQQQQQFQQQSFQQEQQKNQQQFKINNLFSSVTDTGTDDQFQQLHHQQQPLNRDESQIISDIDYEDAEVEHSYRQAAVESNNISYPQPSSEIRQQIGHNHQMQQQQQQQQQQMNIPINHQRNQSKPIVVVNNGKSSILSNHIHDNNNNQTKRNRIDDFYPSFADSLINYGTHHPNNTSDYQQSNNIMQQHHQYQGSYNQQQQILAQAPLLLQNSGIGNGKRDDDEEEACEIDSDFSNSRPEDDYGEEDQNDSSQVQKQKRNRKLEESIRSSRTATFKTARRTSTQNNTTGYASQQANYSNQQHSQITSALSQAVNVQDSYYATIKSSGMQQNYMNNFQTNPLQSSLSTQSRQGHYDNSIQSNKQKSQQSTNQAYYNKQQSSNNHQKSDSRASSQNRYTNELIDDGQVEVASNHSYGSSKWRTLDNQYNSGSVRIDLVGTFEEQHHNYEKSTRISSLNSIQKNPTQTNTNHNSNNNIIQTSLAQLQNNNNNNNTIISHNSSQSSHSHHKNQNSTKLSAGQHSITQHSSSSQHQQSNNFIDLDLQGKGLKTFEIDYRNGQSDKRQLRSLNLANNSLIKLPNPLEKSIIYMNISYNKLKSLTGIESCVNLKFLNVSGNQLSSASSLVILQSMRELVFSYNQLSILKEIGQLKNLQLLDLSHNKISEIEKIMPLQNCKKLFVLSLQGNIIEKHGNYDNMLKKMLPQVKVQDPDQIKDFSQFSEMEHVCFTEPFNNANSSQLIMVEQLSSMNLRQFTSQEKEKEQINDNNYSQKPRSKTPNRERAKSQIGQLGGQQMNEQKLKSMVISPQRDESDIKRKSNIYKTTTVNNPLNAQQFKANKSPIYNESQFKMQSKYPAGVNPISSARPSKGNITQRNQAKSQLSRERSYTNETQQFQKDKSQTRQQNDRSTSNISRNYQGKTVQSAQGIVSGRSTAQQYNSSNNQTLTSQHTTQSTKDPIVKKVSLNSNTGKYVASQGKITPRSNTALNNNMHTPKQEKVTHYYKKSFCQTEDEGSVVLSTQNDMELIQCTPSQKNNSRPAPLQDSSNKKAQLSKIVKKDPVALHQARMGIISPTQNRNTSHTNNMIQPAQSTKNSNRPVTTLKQRLVGGQSSLQQDSLDQKFMQMNNTTNLAVIRNSNNNQNGSMSMPQSTKNSQKVSTSFVFDNNTFQAQNNQITQGNGRSGTPQNQNLPFSQNRPSSQLQKFIIASQKPQSQQQITVTSSRPSTSHTQMSFHTNQVPSQKLTNLPPRAYQTKTANPGDKKTKADMSLSVISNGNNSSQIQQQNLGNNFTTGPTAATNTSQIQNTSIHSNHQNYQSNNIMNNNNISQSQNPLSMTTIVMNTSNTQNVGNISSISQSKNQSGILQQHTNYQDMAMFDGNNNIYEFAADSQIDDVSSRSMSPVLEESNNIKKLKVDLTQFMNKQ